MGSHDLDGAVFERLAQGVEHVPIELGQLVEEEDAMVRLRHEARPKSWASSDHGGVRGGVMGAAKRPHEPVV